jgi:phosphoenolpyruvate carboxykinase (ATP)
MKAGSVNVWLINTGWSGGSYGVGSRMKLGYTRAMITAALNGELNDVEYTEHKVFGVQMPNTCPNVPNELLSPRNTWKDKTAYDNKSALLAQKIQENFKQFESGVSSEILAAAPRVVKSA